MGDSAEAFYSSAGGGFDSTELTRGPWDPDSQHAGPPCALIARALERFEAPGGSPAEATVARISFEILRPVPIDRLEVEVEVVRPGRTVELLEATLRCGGEELIRARGWRLAAAGVDLPDGLASTSAGAPARAGRPSGEPGRPAGPAQASPAEFFLTEAETGYHTAMDYRFERGGFTEPGPAVCWMRMKVPLVAGEEPGPLVRVLTAADSGNGVSATLDVGEYLFINVDLTVNLHRPPDGEWICLDALTIPEPSGIGLADTMLLDQRGPIGRATQTLLIARR